jgi:hypothetical protein
MTAEERVKQVYPKATARKYETGRGSYYLVWSEGLGTGRRIAEGDTKRKAWKNADVKLKDESK